MAPLAAKKTAIIALIIASVLIIVLSVIFFRLTNKPASDLSDRVSDLPVRGFTLLDLHADSILTEGVRNRLKETLGSVAVERKTVLDLEMHFPGFLERHFPDLSRLNRQLNYQGDRRIRIEHNTTKLIFRYSATFQYVELFFSNYTGKPLLFRIRAKRDGRDYLDTLRQKYGKPQIVIWQEKKGKSVFWSMDTDVMILSLFADQYEHPQFEIMICRVGNIEDLLAAEKEASDQRKSENAGEGRRLF